MARVSTQHLIAAGMRAGDAQMFREDKIWSKYSNDKVDVGERLAHVLRVLSKALPLSKPLRALSIGSSNEPQFRILQTACTGGLYLLDIEEAALDVLRERLRRQHTRNVTSLRGDYTRIFADDASTKRFVRQKLGGKKVDLITLHHSLYYSAASAWPGLIARLYCHVLAPQGAMHAVLMAARSRNPYTTTWLYNHFAGKYFGHVNDQSLRDFHRRMKSNALYASAKTLSRTSTVQAFTGDFERFMSMVWMILLYPNVHPFTREQRRIITETMYRRFFLPRRPLLQEQDHWFLFRGLPLTPRGF